SSTRRQTLSKRDSSSDVCSSALITTIETFDRAHDNFFITLEELVEHLLALGITYALQDGLLGCLGTDTAKLKVLELFFDIVAHLHVLCISLRIGQKLLAIGLLETGLVGHHQPPTIPDVVTALAVNFYADIHVLGKHSTHR